jgi:hypothetical protein
MTGGGEINTYPSGRLQGFETPDIIDRFDANAYAVVTTDGVFITSDITATPIVWTQLGSATSPVNACAVHATQTSPASFYVEAGTCSGSTSHQIFRYDGTAPNAAWQQLVPPLGHSGFGIFAVDGQNSSRLFASVLGGTGPAMMLSVDGGANWSSMPSLDSLMTGAGQFKYSNALGPTDFTGFGGYSQPSLVAFSSLDSQTLVAAGVDSGVFISHDGGATWTTITDNSGSPSNPLIPRAKFASFDRTGAGINIFIGTQGRGVWRVAEQPSMLYRVKFVCGQPVGDALAPGRYFTVINVHNPIEDASTKPINFRMKFAVSPPQQGHTGFGSSFDVGSDDVQKITCGDIIRAANGIANLCSASFCEGFVVLESQAELDVTAVYTAADLTPAQQVTTLHTARVLPHCPIRTEVLPEQTVLFVPPKEGGGDADYDGNGPCVDFRLALQLEDGDKTLAAKYRMHAFECAGDFSKPKADFTSAKGEEKIVLKIASPRGRILGYDVDNSVMQQYIDTNHSDDVFSFNPPSPVKTLRFVGDTIGDEAGTRTGVFITFQQITVELETCAPLTPSPQTEPTKGARLRSYANRGHHELG